MKKGRMPARQSAPPSTASRPTGPSRCVIFGGCGYLGTMLARHFAAHKRFEEIILADIRQAPPALPERVRFIPCDVRHEFTPALAHLPASWIFNFAAVRPEVTGGPREHYDTQLRGAEQLCAYAERVGCEHLLFASSSAVYGQTRGPTDETATVYPETPDAITKVIAEALYQTWQARAPARRLILVRPAPIYGPGASGDIARVLRAVRHGGFFLGGRRLRRSYGYVFGFLESIDFLLGRFEPLLICNYVEPETLPVGEVARQVRTFLASKAPAVPLPAWLALHAATAIRGVLRSRTSLDPDRIHESTSERWIVPRRLQELGFLFQYPFADSLKHWQEHSPADFS